MPIARWADRARQTPDAPGLVTATHTWSCREVAASIASRLDETRRAPVRVLVGAPTTEVVLDVLAAIEARVPLLLLHPRWTEPERERVRARVARTALPAPDETLAILATSGTTGTPKLAVISRRAFVASAEASAAHLGHAPDDRWLLAMPLAHVGGLGVLVRSLVYRAPIVLHEGASDPSAWLPLATDARATHVSVVPTTLARWLERRLPPPPSLRVILLGGAACPASVRARAEEAGLPIHPTYGLTETCGQVATARTGDALELLPGVQVRIERGSIRVRSPAAMDGWLDAPSPFDGDGFYDTGDLGELAGRTLTIHARRTDLVVSGGENVYPREVEDVLERIEGVRAACVFGVPDDVWGQRVVAALVTDASAPSDEEIVRRARRELAGFKVPRAIARLEALAVGETGKLDRARTAERAQASLRPI